MKYLDHTGLVSVEEQKPVAFRQFLDETSEIFSPSSLGYDKTVPVGAMYILLFLFGSVSRVRCVSYRIAEKDLVDLANRKRPGNLSEKYQRSLPPANRRQPVAKQRCKTVPAVTKVDENITQPIDSSPSGGSNGFAAPIGHFLWSLGPSIEGIYSHFVRGLGGEFS
ncbi:hypothetical protein J3R82DRAFT_6011 [Butyriboletus roseoflavus]|nr:hypothetical protein J3R82DRAFT_6011 [Butyriboletus roseoflavus]